jgi:hypothetical protein
MPRLSFTLRDVFWLTLVVAMGAGWWVEHRSIAEREVTFEIRDPSNRAAAVLVRLKIDRLLFYDLSQGDVMEAIKPSGVIHPVAPRGVVFSHLPHRLDQYGEIVIRANPKGEIVRLKDVGRAEFVASH